MQCIVLACVIFLSSCSQKTKMEAMLEQIPESSDLVLIGNLKQIMESAGGTLVNSQVNFPDYLSPMAGEQEEVNDILEKTQIDPEVCAVMVDIRKNYGILLFSLKDKAAFTRALEEFGYTKTGDEDDASFYTVEASEDSEGYSCAVIRGDYAYWADNTHKSSPADAQKELEQIIAGAKESPMSKTKAADYIQDSNAMGMIFQIPEEFKEKLSNSGIPAFVWDIYSGQICIKSDLQGNKCIVNCALFNEDGNQKKATDFGLSFDTKAKIDKEALTFLDPKECLVAASCMKDVDWDKYFETLSNTKDLPASQKGILAIMKSYMEKLDGTMAFGLGLEDGMQSIYDISQGTAGLDPLHMTLLLETKEGMAQGIVNDLASFAEQAGVQVEKKDNGITITVPNPYKDVIFYAETHNNLLVLSNHPISQSSDNFSIKSVDFCSYQSVFALAFDKGDKMMTDLGIDYGLIVSGQTTAQPYESTLTIETIGAPSTYGIVGTIANSIIQASMNGTVEKRWSECASENSIASHYDEDEEIDPEMTFSE